jgi:hypothetical protein
MPSRFPHGAAAPMDPAPTVRAWFDALLRGDLRTLKTLTHPEFQFRGDGPAAFAPGTGRRAVLDRAKDVRKGLVVCPTLIGVERLPGGGFLVMWELRGENGQAVERGLSFAHADSHHVRSVATHAVPVEEQETLAPPAPVQAPSTDRHSLHPEGWDALRERVRLSGTGWLNDSSRTPLPTIPWEDVRRWGWRLASVAICAEFLMLVHRMLG